MNTLETATNPLNIQGQNDGEYCIKIKYERNQLKETLEHELQQRSIKKGLNKIIDLVIIVFGTKFSGQQIRYDFRQLDLIGGKEYLRVDGSYKFIRKSELNRLIASRMESMLKSKLVARDLMTQRQYQLGVSLSPDLVLSLPESIKCEIPEREPCYPYFPITFDGCLNSELSVLIASVLGDTFGDIEYPPLVIEVGDSQSASELLFNSLLHLRAQGMPTDTVITADVQIGVQDDEITISRFDLHHFDFSIENLRSILHVLPNSESADNIRKRESLMWAIGIRCRRLIAQLDCLLVLVEETILLDQALERADSHEASIKAKEAAILRMDERTKAIISADSSSPQSRLPFHVVDDERFLDDWLTLYRVMQQTVGSLGGHGTIIDRIEETRQNYLEAQLATFDLSHHNNSEVEATEQVIALVLDTHATYPLNTPEKMENGFRIPVSSIQIIPTGQDWIDVTPADLQELYMTAVSYVAENTEGCVANMIVHKEGVKQQYHSQFLEMARGTSTIQTFDELFAGINYIDGAIQIGFVSTDNIVAYMRAQGIALNPTANRVIAVSKLLELSVEEAQIYFLLRPHTMDYILSHRRSEAAMDILNSLGESWDQDPWNYLQELVRCQERVTTQLALKYFTNAGLIELIWMYGLLGHRTTISRITREKSIKRLSESRAQYGLPLGWEMQAPGWIDNIMINVRLLDRFFTRQLLQPKQVIELLQRVTDPELQRKITETAFADPGSFAVVLQISSEVEDFLAELDLAFPNLGLCSF